MKLETAFTRQIGVEYPIICGAMYPCSNPELVAAVSAAGGIGIVQPISLTYVFKHDLREGLRLIRRLTDRPIGFNVIVEKSARAYEVKMQAWVDLALEEGVKLFITALGNPKWVVDRAHAAGGIVYHDVTSRDWALKAVDHGVDGLICVNDRAGGHAGQKSPEQLHADLADLGKPLICAGGVGSEEDFVRVMRAGYAGVQMGTRFIACEECKVHSDYKNAILRAGENDIVLSEKISGVPCAVIRTPYIDKVGTKAGPIARWLLRGRRTKRIMRSIYALLSIWKLRGSALQGMRYQDYFQAGKSVEGIESVEPAGAIVKRFAEALQAAT